MLTLFAATFLLSLVPRVRQFMDAYLLIRPELALGKRPWELVTGPLVMTGFFPLLFLGLLLWSIGSAVEEQVGRRRLWLLSLGASLSAALLAAVVGRILPGSRGQLVILDGGPVFMMILWAFARLYPTLKVTMWGIGEPVSARTLSYFFIGLGLVADVLRMQWPELGGAVGALLGSYLLLRDGGPSLITRLRARFFPKKRKKPTTARTKSGIEVVVLDGGRASQRSPYGASSDSPKPRSPGSGGKDRYLN